MTEEQNEFWFAAKHYGLGWSLPVTWQGWATIAAWALLLIGILPRLPDRRTKLICFVVLTGALIAVVIWKGERPVKWRWGGR